MTPANKHKINARSSLLFLPWTLGKQNDSRLYPSRTIAPFPLLLLDLPSTIRKNTKLNSTKKKRARTHISKPTPDSAPCLTGKQPPDPHSKQARSTLVHPPPRPNKPEGGGEFRKALVIVGGGAGGLGSETEICVLMMLTMSDREGTRTPGCKTKKDNQSTNQGRKKAWRRGGAEGRSHPQIVAWATPEDPGTP